MKIPKGMTEQEVIETITKVVDRQAAKFRFGYYEIEDMRQEAFIIAMDALDRYDEKRPLENFLAVHVNNRLKNFKRDNFYRMDNEKHESKKLIMDPIDISRVRDVCHLCRPLAEFATITALCVALCRIGDN